MELVEVHPFDTLEAAQAFCDAIDVGEGWPKPGGTTLHYTMPFPFDGYFIVPADDITKQYTTDPTTWIDY